ncbi:sensor histidine kinase [Pseudoduganella sp. UC29_106]|uniref:sensor histidine kinase n=1 Tax=Pseudoduganella sp. UC29_106 TaxID=3374553 RepID=UPI003756417B
MPSIRLRLLKWLIGPILLLNLAGGALVYGLAWLPAQMAFDQSLADAASALGARLQLRGERLEVDLPRQAEQVLRNDDTDAVYFAVRDAGGRLVAGDAQLPPQAARSTPQGFDSEINGEPVRMVSVAESVGGQRATIMVAKTLRKRTQTRAAIVRAMLPLAALLTLASAGLAWFAVTRGLQPLQRLRADIKARAADDVSPIPPADVPQELAPVVSAFNGLLDRVQEGAKSQQDFLANVAHQLRTPLAGLRTQLEWLEQHHSSPATAHSLDLMLSSTERMIRQVNQLLALARAEPAHFEKRRLEPLSLDQLVGESIQHFVEQAGRKEIDLGFELQPTRVRGDRFLLRDLIDNLVDNALRYTPPHGTVTVSCFPHKGGGLLTVEDSGPGIPPAKREAVFSRFVRLDEKTTGSGLGLAIVRDIASAHGGSVNVDAAPGGEGALFTVRFPS